jgi:hypothetical protein
VCGENKKKGGKMWKMWKKWKKKKRQKNKWILVIKKSLEVGRNDEKKGIIFSKNIKKVK